MFIKTLVSTYLLRIYKLGLYIIRFSTSFPSRDQHV